MSVTSIFNLRFAPEDAAEGRELALAIGADMIPTTGCTGYHVINDLQNSGNFVVITRWDAEDQGAHVLETYAEDPKVRRVAELMGKTAPGILGEVIGGQL